MPELAAEAKKVRETVRRQSWTGRWFCDNAVRQPDGSLRLSGKCTETCQYYAFMFGTATPQLYPDLWRTLLEDFGPKRHETKKHPEIYFSNAFIGNYLRLELLSRARLDRQLLDETKGYFSYMAERTGTLWEHELQPRLREPRGGVLREVRPWRAEDRRAREDR
jgi:alpha-L-rhamnosidase